MASDTNSAPSYWDVVFTGRMRGPATEDIGDFIDGLINTLAVRIVTRLAVAMDICIPTKDGDNLLEAYSKGVRDPHTIFKRLAEHNVRTKPGPIPALTTMEIAYLMYLTTNVTAANPEVTGPYDYTNIAKSIDDVISTRTITRRWIALAILCEFDLLSFVTLIRGAKPDYFSEQLDAHRVLSQGTLRTYVEEFIHPALFSETAHIYEDGGAVLLNAIKSAASGTAPPLRGTQDADVTTDMLMALSFNTSGKGASV